MIGFPDRSPRSHIFSLSEKNKSLSFCSTSWNIFLALSSNLLFIGFWYGDNSSRIQRVPIICFSYHPVFRKRCFCEDSEEAHQVLLCSVSHLYFLQTHLIPAHLFWVLILETNLIRLCF